MNCFLATSPITPNPIFNSNSNSNGKNKYSLLFQDANNRINLGCKYPTTRMCYGKNAITIIYHKCLITITSSHSNIYLFPSIYSFIRLQIAQCHKLITRRLEQQHRHTNRQLIDGKRIAQPAHIKPTTTKTCVSDLGECHFELSWMLKSTHHLIHYKLQHEPKQNCH